MHGDGVSSEESSGLMIMMIWYYAHKAIAQVLGNVTYAEVVVSSAGLAALSAQT